jgi:hypothetical protein
VHARLKIIITMKKEKKKEEKQKTGESTKSQCTYKPHGRIMAMPC